MFYGLVDKVALPPSCVLHSPRNSTLSAGTVKLIYTQHDHFIGLLLLSHQTC